MLSGPKAVPGHAPTQRGRVGLSHAEQGTRRQAAVDLGELAATPTAASEPWQAAAPPAPPGLGASTASAGGIPGLASWAVLLAFLAGALIAWLAPRLIAVVEPAPSLRLEVLGAPSTIGADTPEYPQGIWLRNPTSHSARLIRASWNNQPANLASVGGLLLAPGQTQWVDLIVDPTQPCRPRAREDSLVITVAAEGSSGNQDIQISPRQVPAPVSANCGASSGSAGAVKLTRASVDQYRLQTRYLLPAPGALTRATAVFAFARFSWASDQLTYASNGRGSADELTFTFPAPPCDSTVPADGEIVFDVQGMATVPGAEGSQYGFVDRVHLDATASFAEALGQLQEARC